MRLKGGRRQLTPGNNTCKITRQHEGHPLPGDAELFLLIIEYVSEVDVEESARVVNHDVVVVPVSNAQHEGGHAVASAAVGKATNGRLVGGFAAVGRSLLLQEPLVQLGRVDLHGGADSLALDRHDGLRVADDLYETHLAASRQATVSRQVKVEAFVLPDAIHHLEEEQTDFNKTSTRRTNEGNLTLSNWSVSISCLRSSPCLNKS